MGTRASTAKATGDPRGRFATMFATILLCGLATTIATAAAPKRDIQRPASGRTIDGHFQGLARHTDPNRDYAHRIFVTPQASALGRSTPIALVVFVHGTNAAEIPFRWMGGGREGDVRAIAETLQGSGATAAFIVAAPSTTLRGAIVNARTSWPQFDLARFVFDVQRDLGGQLLIDLDRVILVGHSGAGCNKSGGLLSASRGPFRPQVIVSVDTCMERPSGRLLAQAAGASDVVVAWQTQSWSKRPFREFIKDFKHHRALRIKPWHRADLWHHRVKRAMPHDAMVPITLAEWLPKLLPPGVSP